MTTKQFLLRAIIYLFVLSSGVQVGAALYEVTVVTPLWAGAPPGSVLHWNPMPAYAINPGSFWRVSTPFYALSGLLMVLGAWAMPRRVRRLALLAGGIGLLAFVVTISYFVPSLIKLIVNNGAGMSGEAITHMVQSWTRWNWVRLGAIVAAWLMAIRALSLVEVEGPRVQVRE